MSPEDRLGFHYFPDDRHFTSKDLDTWLPILRSLGARWLVLRTMATHAVPEPFVRGLIDAGIQPIIHIPMPVGDSRAGSVVSLFPLYARWGVQHVVVHDRPNQRQSWNADEWGRTALVERFVDLALPSLQAQLDAGLEPTLPPFEPGGDYWDLAFLDMALRSLVRRGQDRLLARLTLAIYAWTNGKPLDWGAGASARWPDVRPYVTPSGSQDHRGFRIFDWYGEIAARVMGRLPQMLVIAGGALLPPDPQDADLQSHAALNQRIARGLIEGAVPDMVKNFSFYTLSAGEGSPDRAASWYPDPSSPRPVVAAIQALLPQHKSSGPTICPEKPIAHYVLLPRALSRLSPDEWRALAAFASAFQPVMGFSPEVAMMAKVVSLICGEDEIPLAVERQLKQAGCVVHRLPGILNAASPTLAPAPAAFPAGGSDPLQ